MFCLMRRIMVGICFAAAAGLTVAAVSEASTTSQEGPARTDCQECHASVVSNWENSAHGKATVDPTFQQAWKDQGSPSECLACHSTGFDPETGTWAGEGIECSVCHSPQTAPHPEIAMPTDPSSRLCGTCHVDTYAEWQTSAHGEGEMACVRCHNPHTTSLRVGNMQDLCSTCHNEEGHFYAYSAHAQQGLLCTDCHLRVNDAPMGEGHGLRQHTFTVDLHTCNQCHAEEMHLPNASENPGGDEELMWSGIADPSSVVVASASGSGTAVENEPEPAQPLNYFLAAAAGLGFGIAVTPWAESWFRRIVMRD